MIIHSIGIYLWYIQAPFTKNLRHKCYLICWNIGNEAGGLASAQYTKAVMMLMVVMWSQWNCHTNACSTMIHHSLEEERDAKTWPAKYLASSRSAASDGIGLPSIDRWVESDTDAFWLVNVWYISHCISGQYKEREMELHDRRNIWEAVWQRPMTDRVPRALIDLCKVTAMHSDLSMSRYVSHCVGRRFKGRDGIT